MTRQTDVLAPGWKPDPEHAGHQRYWDGANWIGQPVPGGTPVAAQAPRAVGPPAGWYPDPSLYGQERYWNGAQWAADVRAVATGAAQNPKSGKATVSMVLGIIGLAILPFSAFTFFAVPSIILGVLAVVFGQQGRSEIARSPGMGGAAQAKAGLITGSIALGLVLILVLLAVVVGVLAAV